MNNLKNKIKHNKSYFYILAFIVVSGFLFLGNAGKANAEYCSCQFAGDGGQMIVTVPDPKDTHWTSQDSAACKQQVCEPYCAKNVKLGCSPNSSFFFGGISGTITPTLVNSAGDISDGGGVEYNPESRTYEKVDNCPWERHPINCSLVAVLQAEGLGVEAAQTLFTYIVDVKGLKSILDNPILYEVWKWVRDLLNIIFILVLLFTAFCTIFQVEKYNYKKILLTLVIMALLVNFSYPIVRVIIDFSNVLMYTLLRQNLAGATTEQTFGIIAGKAGVKELIGGGSALAGANTSFLLVAVIFLFIFMITLVVIAVMLLIRAIGLAILIIFSPIAFAGAVIPSGKADKALGTKMYWDKLFQYAFFGPIMVFMLMVALKFMNSVTQSQGNMMSLAKAQAMDSTIVANMAFFAIPIVILWIGIGFAQSMGIAGASAVTGAAKKFAKWGVAGMTGASFAAGAYKAYRARRNQGADRSWRNRLGTELGSRQDQAVAGMGKYVGLGKDARNRFQNDQMNKVADASKRANMENMGVSQLNQNLTSGDKFEKAAAVKALQGKGAFDTANNPAHKKAYEEVRDSFTPDSKVFNSINNGVKKKDSVTALSDSKLNSPELRQREKDLVNSSDWSPKDMNYAGLIMPKKNDKEEDIPLTKAEEAINEERVARMTSLCETGFDQGSMTADDLSAMKGRYSDDSHRKMMQAVTGRLAANSKYSAYEGQGKRVARSIQIGNLRQDGKLGAGATADERSKHGTSKRGMVSEIYSSVKGDDMRKAKLADHKEFIPEFVQNIREDKISEVLGSMEDKELRERYAQELSKDPIKGAYMKNTPAASGWYRGPKDTPTSTTPPTTPAAPTPPKETLLYDSRGNTAVYK